MATARLIASSYTTSGSAVSVSSASNMYTNTDSSNYATLTHTNKNTTAQYVYVKGFNFSSIPSDATVTSFSVKIKGYESEMSTSSSYAPSLVNGTTVLSGTTASSNFSDTESTITIPTGSYTWTTITGYGSDFGVRIPLRRSNKNKQGYVYVYGIEIEVTYTNTHTVSITGTNVTPSGTQTVTNGDNLTITMSGRSVKPTVTDNGVDVSSQLVQNGTTYTYTITNVVADHTVVVSENHVVSITGTNVTPSGTQIVSDGSSLTVTMLGRLDKPSVTDNGVDVTSQVVVGSTGTSSATSHPVDSEDTFSMKSNVGNEYADSTNTTYALYYCSPSATDSIQYGFGELDVPDDGQIAVTCLLKTKIADKHSESVITAQLYSGETSKGTAITIPASIGNNTINGGSWTSAELADVNLVITATSGSYQYDNPGDFTKLQVYGATLTATYSSYNYTYTLTNITTDHTIVVTDSSPSGAKLYVKESGAWISVTKVYKKVSGSWVEQTDLSNLFSTTANYVKGD